MVEYIERDSAAAFAYNCGAVYVSNRLSDKTAFPAADVAPVRHGRWLSWDELHGGETTAKNVSGVFCSECIRKSDSKTHFCHNCGARMDGGIT